MKISAELVAVVTADRAKHPWRYEAAAMVPPPDPPSAPQPIKTVADFLPRILERATIRWEVSPLCESPIEADLAAFMVENFREVLKPEEFAYCSRADYRKHPHKGTLRLFIVPQFKWRRFRIDFALIFGQPRRAIFIECDGKDFHTNPQQIARDRARDQECKAAGIPVLRFTGAEIYRWDQAVFNLIVGTLEQEARRPK